MQVVVKGKQIDVGDALRSHITEKLTSGVGKYFDRAIESKVTMTKDAHLFKADCMVHVGHGIDVQSTGVANDPYAAFDSAAEKVEKRLRRYKRRLRDHHQDMKARDKEVAQAAYYVVQASVDEHEAEPEGLAPTVISEATSPVVSLTVGEAVMRLELSDAPVVMFKDRANGRINVVYRRNDGHIGWIDPQQ